MTSKHPILFRVEDENGVGPYNSAPWDGQTEMCMTHCDDSHKSPNRDPQLDGISYVERCACDTPESLLRWFDGWWEALAAAGFSVTILRAADARYGENGQCVYGSYTDPDIRDTLDIDTFLGLFAPLPCATLRA